MQDSVANDEVVQAATALWAQFTPAERALVPFGLFPLACIGDKMKAHAHLGSSLAVALMKIAEGGQP